MNANGLRDQYHGELRKRLAELDAERTEILAVLEGATPAPTEEVEITARVKAPWSAARRKEHSRRMKRLHREGRFRR